MQKLKILILFLATTTVKNAFSQQDPVVIEYISRYKDLAIAEMQRTGIPASIKLAQGIHETSAGTSDLVRRSNNHFGLKCKSEWTGMTVKHTDDAPNECFRKYEDSKDSYKDQSDYLRKTSRYAFLFDLDPADYRAWAFGLKKAGYATNPKYSQVLIKLIEEYDLQDYTMIALGKLERGQETLVQTEQRVTDKAIGMNAEQEAAESPEKPTTEVRQVIAAVPKPDYPVGEFRINETRVVYATKGTSFLSIAEKYAVPLARLFEFNEMKVQEFVVKDQLVYVMRKRKTGLNDQHVVQRGESLADIAQTEAIRMESLLEYNYLQPSMRPAVGSVLYLRAKAPGMPALATGK